MRIFVKALVILMTLQSNAFTLNDDYKYGWRGPTLRFNINTTNCPTNILSTLDEAFKVWNSVATSNLKLARGNISTTTPAQLFNFTATDSPVIICEVNFGSVTGTDENTIAGVGFSLVRNGGPYIDYGGVILNMSGGNASLIGKSKATQAAIIAHEIGHVLGFGHSEEKGALMHHASGKKQALRLSQDDWDAMTYLYPRDELSGDDLFACGSLRASTPPNWPMLLMWLMPFLMLLALKIIQRRSLQPALVHK